MFFSTDSWFLPSLRPCFVTLWVATWALSSSPQTSLPLTMSWAFLSWRIACPGLPPGTPSPVQSLCSAGSQSDSTSSGTPTGNSFPLCWISALVHVINVSRSLCSGTHPLFTEWVLHICLSNDEFEDNYETNLCESRICVNWKWIG